MAFTNWKSPLKRRAGGTLHPRPWRHHSRTLSYRTVITNKNKTRELQRGLLPKPLTCQSPALLSLVLFCVFFKWPKQDELLLGVSPETGTTTSMSLTNHCSRPCVEKEKKNACRAHPPCLDTSPVINPVIGQRHRTHRRRCHTRQESTKKPNLLDILSGWNIAFAKLKIVVRAGSLLATTKRLIISQNSCSLISAFDGLD